MMHNTSGTTKSVPDSAPGRLKLMHWLVIVLIVALIANVCVLSADIFTRRQSQVQQRSSRPLAPNRLSRSRTEFDEAIEKYERLRRRLERERNSEREDGFPAPQQLLAKDASFDRI
jgi:hypothetical protein